MSAPMYEQNAKCAVFKRLELMEALVRSSVDSWDKAYIAQETLQNYTSLAQDFGLKEIKDRLEDISFLLLHPDERLRIMTQVKELFDLGEQDTLGLILANLAKTLGSNGLSKFQILGRVKSPFSIWQKMKRKNVGVEELRDVLGFRVIVDSVDDCYWAIKILHDIFPVVRGGYKDYISNPKDQVYQSLHTSIIGPRQKRIEIQVRTDGMDSLIKSIYKDYWKQKTLFR